MKKLLMVAASLAFAASAHAADLSIPAPVFTKAPVVAPWSWQDCYAGVLAGNQMGSQQTGTPQAGGLVGCNWQQGALVYGFEGDVDAAKATVAPAPGTLDVKALANVAARLGYATGPINLGPFATNSALLYVKAAIPMSLIEQTGRVVSGWGAAGGVEYTVDSKTSMRIEYRFNDFGGRHAHDILTGLVLYY